ncbi:MAG: Ig-like domain repeat protein, partial [Williamsia herbipolensis]|nr:Ig-like domain repeat protein [Williamsia herbipolensis]
DLDQSLATLTPDATANVSNVGLEVTTPDVGGSVTEYFEPNHTTLPLAAAGQPALRSGGSPGKLALHMRVDFNGDGTFDAVLSPSTSGPADNWYVGSTAPAFVQHRAPSCNIDANGCVSPSTQPSGTSQWNGTLAAWATAFPDAQIQAVGFTAAAGVKGYWIAYSLTAGATAWTYTNSPPVAYPNPDYVPSDWPDPVSVDLTTLVKDADPADTLVFDSTDGRVSFDDSGDILTFTPDKVGTAIVSYTFHDEYGGNPNHDDQTATIQFAVAKAVSTTTMSFSPRKPTSRQQTAVTVGVTSDGSVEAGQVQVVTGGVTRTANVTGGVATVTLPRLAAGKHTVSATFLGTATADTSSVTKTLTVVKPPRSASATTLTFRPNRPTTRQVPTAVVSVSSDGVVAGGKVRVRLGGTVKTAIVHNGIARVRLHKFRLGAHKAVATFLGTTSVAPSTGRATLHVVRPTRRASLAT